MPVRFLTVLLMVLTSLLLQGCQPEQASFVPPQVSPEEQGIAMSKWARSCALCHVNGEGGAPKVGDQEDWQPRLAQGEAVLLEHMVSGFNRMPAMGYCYDCSRQDYLVQVAFMSGTLSPSSEEEL